LTIHYSQKKFIIDLNVQVSDTTSDAMKIKCMYLKQSLIS